MTIYRRQKLYEFYCPVCEYRITFPDLHRADLESTHHHMSGTHNGPWSMCGVWLHSTNGSTHD